VKNSIFRIAAKEAGVAELNGSLAGQMAVVTGQKDISAAAKALKNFAAEFDKLKIKFGFLNNSRLEEAGIIALADLPSLDVLRALVRTPRTLEVFMHELRQAEGADARLDEHVKKLERQFSDPATLEMRARRIVEGMALALQGSLLVRHGSPAVADAFCASRLGGDGGLEYGTLPAGSDFETIIERNRPRVE